MALDLRPSTSEERKQVFTEILLDKTDKVSKISDNSVLNGISYGIAKVSGKAEKDIVQALSKLFPDLAYGSHLDQVAQNFGISPRFGASQSSTYIRVVGDVGTQYVAGTHVFESSDGIQFDIENTTTIGADGFSYVKVRSVDVGVKTKVKPATVTKVTPQPTGHRFCVNETQALNGRDQEDDVQFRQRIKDGANILARNTLSSIEQVFMKINSNILKVFYQGINTQGQKKLTIVTQNGIDLTTSELDELLQSGEKYFALTDYRPFGRQSYGVVLQNIEWQPLDVSFRCELYGSFNPDDVRIDMQVRIAKYLDFRTWESGVDKIEWDNLLQIVKNTRGVKYVPDQYFYPRVDTATDKNKLPRLRGFLMLNLNGGVINSGSGNLNPAYYPNEPDFSFWQTVLRTI